MITYPAVNEFEWVSTHEMHNLVLCAAAADEHAVFDFITVTGLEKVTILVLLPKVLGRW
jgi:hypothetical protein